MKKLKAALPLLVVFSLVVGTFNVGSYDPYNELAVLNGAAEVSAQIPGFDFPDLPDFPDPVVRTCAITTNLRTVNPGQTFTITWNTEGFDVVTINGDTQASVDGSFELAVQVDSTFNLVATTADGNSRCTATVTVQCVPPVVPPPTCTLEPRNAQVNSGDSINLNWTTTNARTVTLTSFGNVATTSGTVNTGPITQNTTYTLTVTGLDNSTVNCVSAVTVLSIPLPTCDAFTATPNRLPVGGGNVTLAWQTTNTNFVVINPDIGAGAVDGTLDVFVDQNRVYTLTAFNDIGNADCSVSIEVATPNPVVTCDAFIATPQALPAGGGTIELEWFTTNASSVSITPTIGAVSVDGSTTTVVVANQTYTLTATGPFGTDTCTATVTVATPDPVPSCDAFTATPGTITRGSQSLLSWSTTNATRVAIDGGIGEVAADGTFTVAPIASITYTLTVFGINNQQVTCTAPIVVEEPPVDTVPSCEVFTAAPTTLPVGGGNVLLTWLVNNASTTTISPTVGTVANSGTTTVAVTANQTFTLTTSDADGDTDSCTVAVVVATPEPTPISCAADVQFAASPTSIRRGDDSSLTWSTSARVTAVVFNQGITATGLSGSTIVSPEVDTEYVLTASVGTTTVACPVRVDVSTGGGGGGGSSSPRCELSVSDNRITRGERVTLRWDSSRATNLVLEDVTNDDTLVTTLNLSSADKQELFDGTLTVRPTKDTDYLITVTRGSRERTCKVSVDVEGPSVLSEIRDQQPLVASIALTDVPYTGFEAGPILTFIFYMLLMAWALYMAYLLVIRRDVIGGMKLASVPVNDLAPRMTQEQIRPDVFVNVRPPEVAASTLPTNLPVGVIPTVGYGTAVVTESDEEESIAMTEIENHAHAQHVLLSSDAVRHFMSTIKGDQVRIAELDKALAIAKTQYPSEDGWVVLNEKRMQNVCEQCQVVVAHAPQVSQIPTVLPAGSGSLAEAIVLGNVVAAYELIGSRAMFALADAAADLDAVYKIRRGMDARASELLMTATATLTNDQILQMIQALTGALDGTYTDEASAVKMAIMKAIKVVA